jgi:hypothetical protein
LCPDASGSDDKVRDHSVVADRSRVSLIVVRMSRQNGMQPDAGLRAAIVEILEHIRITGVTEATFLEPAGIWWMMNSEKKRSHRSLVLPLDSLERICKPFFLLTLVLNIRRYCEKRERNTSKCVLEAGVRNSTYLPLISWQPR